MERKHRDVTLPLRLLRPPPRPASSAAISRRGLDPRWPRRSVALCRGRAFSTVRPAGPLRLRATPGGARHGRRRGGSTGRTPARRRVRTTFAERDYQAARATTVLPGLLEVRGLRGTCCSRAARLCVIRSLKGLAITGHHDVPPRCNTWTAPRERRPARLHRPFAFPAICPNRLRVRRSRCRAN